MRRIPLTRENVQRLSKHPKYSSCPKCKAKSKTKFGTANCLFVCDCGNVFCDSCAGEAIGTYGLWAPKCKSCNYTAYSTAYQL